ncbi:MAG: hypothetical protein PVJ67_03810 [Candidatus Pacearchaeota archaeon]|jgi:hypothetical protein
MSYQDIVINLINGNIEDINKNEAYNLIDNLAYILSQFDSQKIAFFLDKLAFNFHEKFATKKQYLASMKNIAKYLLKTNDGKMFIFGLNLYESYFIVEDEETSAKKEGKEEDIKEKKKTEKDLFKNNTTIH